MEFIKKIMTIADMMFFQRFQGFILELAQVFFFSKVAPMIIPSVA